MNEVILIYLIAFLLAWPLGKYIAAVYSAAPTRLDRIFAPLERPLYRLFGADPARKMSWKTYGWVLLQLHVILGLILFVILSTQTWQPLNPDGIASMRWDLALHTMASFLTNTNQQHYSGQAQLSYFAHTFGIVTVQIVTPAVGMAALMAIARVLLGRPETIERTPDGEVSVGNFHVDLTRGIVRVFVPLAFIVAILIGSQGVPSSFQGAQVVQPLDTAAETEPLRVPIGPVAAMVAIKQIGTNGGGWYGPNSSVPLENPTPISNLVQIVSIILVPVALILAVGFLTGRRRLAAGILGVMILMSAGLASLAIWSENQANPAFVGLAADGGNMESKEVRFGPTVSALWGTFTTQTSNGSVNAMHDSFNAGAGAATLMGMFINATFGGIGVGLINFLIYTLVAAFLASLMVGQRPEFFGRTLEAREIKLISIALLIQPILILGMSAITLANPAIAGVTNPDFHGIMQVVYEYTSAFANNGSGFEGLDDDTVWWNLSCAVNLILGRFIPILAPLAVAAMLATKQAAPVSAGSLDMETPVFAGFTLGVIVLLALLSFLPVLVIGPLALALTL